MNGDTTAELTQRINPIQAQCIPPKRQRRGKLHEWGEAIEDRLAILNDWAPATAAIATLIIFATTAAR